MLASDAFEVSRQTKHASESTLHKVCSFVERKISTAATMGQRDTLAEVPMFIQDAPQYDRITMQHSVSEQLRKRGFHVVILPNFNLYVSWRYPTDEHAEEVVKDEQEYHRKRQPETLTLEVLRYLGYQGLIHRLLDAQLQQPAPGR